jgi:hypothetical protein
MVTVRRRKGGAGQIFGARFTGDSGRPRNIPPELLLEAFAVVSDVSGCDEVGEAEEAVRRDLEGLPGGLPATEQALAIVLSRYLDAASRQIGAAGPAPVSKQILEIMDRLRGAAGLSSGVLVKESDSGLGDLTSRIAARRAASEG